MNSAPEYAEIRAIFHARILADWYQTHKGRDAAYSSVIGSGDVHNWYNNGNWTPQEVFNEYVRNLQQPTEFRIETQHGNFTEIQNITYGGVDLSHVDARSINFTSQMKERVMQAVFQPGDDRSEKTLIGALRTRQKGVLYRPSPEAIRKAGERRRLWFLRQK